MLIKDLYRRGRTVVSLEVFPPKKDSDIESVYGALGAMSALKPDFISVTYGAGGSMNTNKTAEVASFILHECKVEPLAHLTCVGADKNEITRIFDDFNEKGIHNTLALRGDLPENSAADGDYHYAEELIADIRARGGFCVGAACYPEGHLDCESVEKDLEYMFRKQEAGADFMVTQLCFDNDIICGFLERARKRGINVPISVGVMPILGRTQIERMVFMCGVSLPSAIVKLLHKYESNQGDLYKAGVEYAARQLEGLISRGVDGVHIYTMNKPDIAERCVRSAGAR